MRSFGLVMLVSRCLACTGSRQVVVGRRGSTWVDVARAARWWSSWPVVSSSAAILAAPLHAPSARGTMCRGMILMKFGGTSVGSSKTIETVYELVRAALPRQPVVVVSAHSGVTDMLFELAQGAPLGKTDITHV